MATAATVFRDYETDGVPSSGAKKPKKSEIRQWGAWLESIIGAFTANGGLIYTSLSSLNSDLDHDAKASAWLIDGEDSGIYQKQGAAGGGSWLRVADLPYSYLRLDDVGAGSANAIQTTSSIPTSPVAIRVANVFEANTGNVTISENGAAAKSLRTNSGNQIAPGGLVAGGMIVYVDDGTNFRLLSDQASAAIVSAAEAAQAAAEIARDEAEAAAAAAALRDPESFAIAGNGTTGPYDVGETIAADSAIVVFVSGVAQIVGTDFTYAGSNITFTSITPTVDDVVHGFVFASRAVGVPTSASVGVESVNTELKGHIPSLSPNASLVDESATQLKLNYHVARAAWHVKAFGSTLTAVGSGNVSTDTLALQSAMDSGEIISITGTTLHINDAIDVTSAGANVIGDNATRVGVNASSKIVVDDDALTKLFNIQQPNFEASGFFVECGTSNTATTLFHFERAPGSASDIDAEIENIGCEGGAKIFHVYGRGLKVENVTSGNVKTCIGDIDWPSSWTPNGSSNDMQETAMRGYEFRGIRMHGAAAGIRNIGANRHNLRGMIVSDIQADIGIGSGIFVGVPGVGSKFSNLVANIGATIGGGLLDLWEGSRDATFDNMSCAGIKTGSVTRLNRTAIILRASTANPIEDLTFSNVNIGPCNRSGVSIQGYGAAKNICFIGASWDRSNIEGTSHFPIIITESGGTFTEVTIKLGACNFKFGGETPSNYVLGGLNSSVVTLYKDNLTTKPVALPWAQSNVVLA